MISLNNKISLILVGCILFCCVLACEDNKEHPKDEQLIQNFQNHRADFDKLVQMFQEDKSLGRVANDFTRTSNFFEKCNEPNGWNGKKIEVSEERLKEYRELFNTLKLPKGIEGYCEKDVIWLYASSRGLSISGSSKGYIYSFKKPEIVIDDLNNFQPKNKNLSNVFRHIDGNWYLFIENN